MTLQNRVEQGFLAKTGRQPDLVVQAPGRVNLIGEHTDYNDCFVLPAAINFRTVIALAQRPDRQVRVFALDLDERPDQFLLDASIVSNPTQPWSNYIRGAVKILLDKGFEIGGADLTVTGDIPKGTGLSSSASLLVAVIEAFKSSFHLALAPNDVALLAQKAENDFVGVNVGIMDQMISARGERDHALLLDCSSLHARLVAIPDSLSIMIVNSGVERGLVGSAYNERRQQCSAAAAFFGVRALRDVDLETLTLQSKGLDALTLRRARHVVTEHRRVSDMAAAMEANDIKSIGALMAQSHASMRDDFHISVPKVDELVAILQEEIGLAGGARMTGGGFGGCTVALLRRECAAAVAKAVSARYRTPAGTAPAIYFCSAERGAGLLDRG